MDKTINPARPLVAWANRYQFGPGERLAWKQVRSRVILWCCAGSGTVRSGGHQWQIARKDALVLPWRHAVEYCAAARNPFMVGAVHLVPHDPASEDAVFQVAHNPQSPLVRSGREDRPLAGFEEPVHLNLRHHPRLERLCDYIVTAFSPETASTSLMRPLALVLLAELRCVADSPVSPDPHPPELQSILQYLQDHLAQPVTIDDLTDLSQLSPSTISRLFRRHLDTTPGQWIAAQRIARAAELLRATRMTIAAVAREAGYDDAAYFSRCFRKRTGVSPGRYRKGAAPL